MRAWWCHQSGQWEVERPSNVVCSADSTADGGNVLYRKTVGDVKAEDGAIMIQGGIRSARAGFKVGGLPDNSAWCPGPLAAGCGSEGNGDGLRI